MLESDQVGLMVKLVTGVLGFSLFQPPLQGPPEAPRLGHVLMAQPSCCAATCSGVVVDETAGGLKPQVPRPTPSVCRQLPGLQQEPERCCGEVIERRKLIGQRIGQCEIHLALERQRNRR